MTNITNVYLCARTLYVALLIFGLLDVAGVTDQTKSYNTPSTRKDAIIVERNVICLVTFLLLWTISDFNFFCK